MRIGIDLSIVKVNRAGSGVYAAGLYEALSQLSHEHDFRVFSAPRTKNPNRWQRKFENFYHDIAWKHAVLPFQAAHSHIDVLHEPNFISPIITNCPVVVSILDISVLKMPDYFSGWFRNYARVLLPKSAHTAKRIITISEYSKQEMVDFMGISPEKITVTYLDVSPRFKVLTEAESTPVLEKYNLKQPFILSVCTLEPRKNILRLVQAYAEFKAHGFPHQLIHVGAKGWQYDEIFAEVERLGLQNDVRFLDRAPLDDLISLYNRAGVFVYPSLYEGFGLPILEAMRCGCPVITSNTSSLPEVIGDAGIMIDPLSTSEITRALESVLSSTLNTQAYSLKSLEQAKKFSWARCANETMMVYQQVHNQLE